SMRRTSLFHASIITLALLSTIHAQPDTLWTKSIGGELTDVFYSVEPVTGGGYIVGGYTESNPDTSRDYWLARLNSTGDDTVWTKSFAAGDTEGRMAIATSDGGAVIVGSGNPRIIKTDGDGTVLWRHRRRHLLDRGNRRQWLNCLRGLLARECCQCLYRSNEFGRDGSLGHDLRRIPRFLRALDH
ncbi:hypothetical protein ACFL32_00880, partial [Candidatus Neomarinimicrobiota bacterium]